MTRSAVRRSIPSLLGLATLACSTSAPSNDLRVRVDPRWVSGEAAKAVGADGFFAFPPPPPGVGELPRGSLTALADAAIAFVGGSVGGLREQIEINHGAPIDFGSLRRCGRVLRRATNFADPGQSTPHYVRTPLGPSDFVDYCQGGDLAVTV